MINSVLFLKLIKFCVVGFSGMLIDFGFTWLLKEKIKTNKYLANSVGFILAASSNYLINRVWTFNSHNQLISIEYLLFIGIALIGLGLNNAIIYILTTKFNRNFYLAKLFAIGCVTIWNFGMNYFFTFK